MITVEELKAAMNEAWNKAEHDKKYRFGSVDFHGSIICASIDRFGDKTITIYENPNNFAGGNHYSFAYNSSLLTGEFDDVLEHVAAILLFRLGA